jgi:hypothetical protein
MRSLGLLPHEHGYDRTRDLRIIAIASFDIALSLPVGLVSLIFALASGPSLIFWPGWAPIHDDWGPVFTLASEWRGDTWLRFRVLWNEWVNVVLGLAFFTIFGLAPEARRTYQEVWRAVGRWFGLVWSVLARRRQENEYEASFLRMGGVPVPKEKHKACVPSRPPRQFEKLTDSALATGKC